MNAVHNVLSWLKANPIPVICVIITLASAVTFYTPTYTSSEKLRGQLNARGGQISSIQQLQMTPGVIPASEPDAPPINVTMTVNKAAIDKLTQVFKDLDNEYTGIFDQAADYNQQGHEVMLADIFPNVKDASKPFRARDAYKVALEDLYSTLNAKPVPDEQYKTNALAEVEQSFLLSRNLTSLNPADKEIVVQRQTDKLLEVYNFHAGGISVYADTTELDELQGKWQPGPLQVMEWAKNGPKPLQFEIGRAHV